MPRRPSVRCKHQGCIELVTPPSRYCKPHQRDTWNKQKIVHSNNPFYKSQSWIKTRDAFAARNPSCNMCGRQGAVVDHIVAIKQGGAPFDWGNLQRLCRACDQTKRGKERHATLALVTTNK
jgi:5-methylcytosine-specific restriction protein A